MEGDALRRILEQLEDREIGEIEALLAEILPPRPVAQPQQRTRTPLPAARATPGVVSVVEWV